MKVSVWAQSKVHQLTDVLRMSFFFFSYDQAAMELVVNDLAENASLAYAP